MLKNARRHSTALTLAVLASLLAGCGGGSGTPAETTTPPAPTPQPPTEAQGVYQGKDSAGRVVSLLVLEDGSYWDIYGQLTTANILLVEGFSTGTIIKGTPSNGTASNGNCDISTDNSNNFCGPIYDFDQRSDNPEVGQVSGQYWPGSNVLGQATANGITITYDLPIPVTSTYDYNAIADNAKIAGTWIGQILSGEVATVTITNDGTLSGSSVGGCVFDGQSVPRPTGKNVYNVSLTFHGSPCTYAHETLSGVAVTYPLPSGAQELLVGLVNSSKSIGEVFFAQH